MRRLRGLVVRGLSGCASVLLLCGTASAQGLAPPAPLASSAPGSPTLEQQQQSETTRKLDEAEQKDSGRNFELFWLDASLGGSYIDMSQFSSESFQIEKSSAAGPAFSAGAGVRFVLFVLGARLRHAALSSFNMWQVNAEAGLKLPVSSFDFLVGAHGGYSFVGRLDDVGLATNTSAPAANTDIAIRGFNAGVDVAFDYYISPLFSVGAGILGDFLFLDRPPVDKPAGFASLTQEQRAAIESDPIFQKSGSSAGLQIAGGLRLGVHFGL